MSIAFMVKKSFILDNNITDSFLEIETNINQNLCAIS